MMKEPAQTPFRYELIYAYLHCIGRMEYRAGVVDTEAEAEEWVRARQKEKTWRMRVPDEDPVRWCPVRHCHMKRQTPWFSYREVFCP
jgi:hypothetical protein